MAYPRRTRGIAPPPGINRRFAGLIVIFFVFVSLLYLGAFRDGAPLPGPALGRGGRRVQTGGAAIAPKLGNETVKAELGRAAWKVLHTTFARFPDEPTTDESEALLDYIHLFQRLYPCGECATHFGELLKKYPPQVSSRSTAAAWGCHVHNQVNKKLKKEMFDCANIGDFYDCGCADDDAEKAASKKKDRRKGDEESDDEGKLEWDVGDYQRGG